MRIGWTDNSNDEDNFVLERSLSSGSGFTEIATPTNNYYDNTGLTAGTRYYYRVAADNEIGQSTWATGDRFTSSDTWVDSVDYTVIYSEDFDDFPTTNTHVASSPVGIPNAYFPLYWERSDGLFSDDANNPTIADNADIVSVDGDNALKSWYLEDQCCTGAASDSIDLIINEDGKWDGVVWGGTGVNPAFTLPAITRVLVYSYNIFIMDGFENADGFKLPGIATSKGTYGSEGGARNMVIDATDWGGTNMDISFYHRRWISGTWPYGTYATPQLANNTKSLVPDTWLTSGVWHHIALYMDAGTTLSYNGVLELFIDGVKIGPTQWAPAHASGMGYINTGDNAGWQHSEFSTFMGGEGKHYMSPQDQWILFDDLVIYTLDSYPYPADVGEAIYTPTICNWPK
jgi:hypothetical protein